MRGPSGPPERGVPALCPPPKQELLVPGSPGPEEGPRSGREGQKGRVPQHHQLIALRHLTATAWPLQGQRPSSQEQHFLR